MRMNCYAAGGRRRRGIRIERMRKLGKLMIDDGMLAMEFMNSNKYQVAVN